jgi:hypothetical protein
VLVFLPWPLLAGCVGKQLKHGVLSSEFSLRYPVHEKNAELPLKIVRMDYFSGGYLGFRGGQLLDDHDVEEIGSREKETKMTIQYRIAETFTTHEKPDDFSVVVIIESHGEVEEVFKTLQRSGIELKKCSIVGKENLSGEFVTGYYHAGNRIAYWGKKGAFWGEMWRALNGSAFFMIPTIGPVLVGGPLVSSIIGALEGAMTVSGLSALGAGFYALGIPQRSVVAYEMAVKEDRYVAMVHGNAAETAAAKTILESITNQEISAMS